MSRHVWIVVVSGLCEYPFHWQGLMAIGAGGVELHLVTDDYGTEIMTTCSCPAQLLARSEAS